MSFILLPPETIVCRYLKVIIAGDLYLQYILELDTSGYMAPRLIRQDLDYGEMIQAVRNHRNRWQHLELGEPESIEVPDAVHTLFHEGHFIDGVNVLHFGGMTTDGDITSSLHFYQLSSFNKGTDYRHWVHDDLDITACSLVIQPEVDLMVLLEYFPPDEPTPGWHQDQIYRIHLRTMTSNKPHPLAMSSAPFLDIGKLSHRHYDDSSPMTLYGRILALRFVPSPYGSAFRPFIVLFDWIAGVEIGRVELESYAGCFIAFLSEEYFVVPQGYKHQVSSTNHNYQAGNLLIFHIPLCAEEPENRWARHVATLSFPRLCDHQNELRLRLSQEASPIPDTTFWSKQMKSIPKIYELSRWNHLCLHYEAFNKGNAPRPSSQPQWYLEKDLGTSGLLYISSQALLTLVSQYVGARQVNEPVLIPWETWGSHAARLPVMDFPGAYMWGRKSAFIHYGAHDESHSQLVILDFIPNGRSTQQLIEDQKAVDVPSPRALNASHAYNQKGAISPKPVVGKFIEPESVMPDMRYRITIVNLESEKHQNLCAYGLEIDDEHLVTTVEPPRNVTGRQFFSVYTI